MYQEFFKLNTLPFNLTPNPQFYCDLKGHQEALNVLEFSIKSGEGFIKIIGEVGSGKTLLCRKILDSLDNNYMTAYISNPELTPLELRKAFAREIELDPSPWQDQHELLTAISRHLIQLHAKGKRVVLFIDEAQALSDEALETVRLLTNLETENCKLLQVVLFGQPELDDRLNHSHLRQLKQRITFSYKLPLMSRHELDVYLNHRLAVAGHTHGNLFTKKARKLLYQTSGGVPRLVNILSHKALLVAYGKRDTCINHKAVVLAAEDTEASHATYFSKTLKIIFSISLVLTAIAAMLFLSRNISL